MRPQTEAHFGNLKGKFYLNFTTSTRRSCFASGESFATSIAAPASAARDDFDARNVETEACRIVLNGLAALVGKEHVVFFRAVPVSMAYENYLEVGIRRVEVNRAFYPWPRSPAATAYWSKPK